MISKENTKHMAKLARLGLSEKEIKKFGHDLSSILDYIETLKKVNTDTIEPTFHTSEEFINQDKVLRQDITETQIEETVNKLIELAPDKKKRHIKVKSVFN